MRGVPQALTDVDPFAWLKLTLERLADGWPNSRIDDLMPWNWKAEPALSPCLPTPSTWGGDNAGQVTVEVARLPVVAFSSRPLPEKADFVAGRIIVTRP